MSQPSRTVPILNLNAQYQSIQTELEATILEVLRSGHYILGKHVAALEEKVAALCGAKYGIGVANGTDALLLALWALDIGPGDEVITSPFTFAATVEAIALRGATPVFVDIDPDSFNIEPSAIEKAITKRTKAIMPVHLYGLPAQMDPINAIAQRYGLKVIEDNAQGIGATYKGRATGGLSDLACTSFYPTKNLGAAGDAGMIVTSDAALNDRLRSIRAHGMRRRYYHDELGVNSRLDELQAATLLVKLPHLAKWNSRRAEIAALYEKNLKHTPGIVTPSVSLAGGQRGQATEQVQHVYHQYTVRVQTKPHQNIGSGSSLMSSEEYLANSNRDAVIAGLSKQGIGSMCYYPVPLHLQTAFAYLGHKLGDFPISEHLSREVLSLPMYPELSDEDVHYVSDCLNTIMTTEIAPLAVPAPATSTVATVTSVVAPVPQTAAGVVL
ncbi:MAG: DegT/DnrJ/EryC1/StrS family aminotransferase [Cyanobacteria bacterium REEB67]|nr:DegT/DnrJ/EryC1/StrS family aminotransferase [Cyanobacteria bacterium REEB67]